MPGTYAYSSLANETSFRLLYLHSGTNPSGLQCSLVHFPLNQHPQYEALSYEWRKAEGVTTILCGTFTIEVTLNLALALEAFRHASKARVLWVDAICIDQGNVTEKASQVSKMRDIYANAGSVLVWLGPSCSFTSVAFQVLYLLAFLWVERRQRGMEEDNPVPYTLSKRPKGSIFLSTDDKIWMSPSRGYHERTITLSRPSGRDDDDLLHLDSTKLWAVIDDLFGSTYFERTWIQQEVAVSNAVYVTSGHYQMPFDLFGAAYGGRNLLEFVWREHRINDDRMVPFSCVRDARKRYQNPEFGSDLASVLATFNYSKESIAHDHIFAPLALVKSNWACGHVKVDYTKALSSVFVEAATCIISDRQDLYLWGSKSSYSNRTRKDLPSWVPEWTGVNCEEAIEYFRHGQEFKCLLPGNYDIHGQSLHVDSHIVDEIEFSAPVDTEEQIIDVMLDLHQRGFDFFGRYMGGAVEGEPSHETVHLESDLRQSNMVDVFWVVFTFSRVSDLLINVLAGLFKARYHPLDQAQLNIEALWAVLTPITSLRPQTKCKPPCERLFLMALLFLAFDAGRRGRCSIPHGRPKMYSQWAIAAIILMNTSGDSLTELLFEHLSRSNMKEQEQVFFTKKGYFGRARLPNLKRDCVVAIIGGAWIPYILEPCDRHYRLYSHAYVEGIMNWKRLPRSALVEQIELK